MKARCRTSSPKRFRIEDSTSGWRYSGRSVSGRRSQAATRATTPMMASTQKRARQPHAAAGRQPLQKAQQNQMAGFGREGAADARQDVDHEAAQDDRPAAEAVARRAIEDLAGAEG